MEYWEDVLENDETADLELDGNEYFKAIQVKTGDSDLDELISREDSGENVDWSQLLPEEAREMIKQAKTGPAPQVDPQVIADGFEDSYA